MKSLFLALPAAMLALAAPALAADYGAAPPPPEPLAVHDWTGFYIGVNGGYGFDGKSDLKIKEQFDDETIVTNFHNIGDLDRQGAFGGGQIGYNFEMNGFVFGIEADIQGAGIDDSRHEQILFDDDSGDVFLDTKASSDITWFGTVRGRLGWAIDTVLIYGTGGLAYGNVDNTLKGQFFDGDFFKASDNQTTLGWAAGGGVEWAFAENWSVKAEYQYINLGSRNLNSREFDDTDLVIEGVKVKTSVDTHFQTVRAGVNWHF